MLGSHLGTASESHLEGQPSGTIAPVGLVWVRCEVHCWVSSAGLVVVEVAEGHSW